MEQPKIKRKNYRAEDDEPIDNTIEDADTAEQFLNKLAAPMLELALEDLLVDVNKYDKYNLPYQNVALKRNRASSLLWIWKPDEAISEELTFEQCCSIVGILHRDFRRKVYKLMTEQEKEEYLKYQPFFKP